MPIINWVPIIRFNKLGFQSLLELLLRQITVFSGETACEEFKKADLQKLELLNSSADPKPSELQKRSFSYSAPSKKHLPNKSRKGFLFQGHGCQL